jgi:GT2 family glycosyltransferase/glycosyltransferase involved in cell wall biosynthesis
VIGATWGSSARQRLRLWPLYAAVAAGDAIGRLARPRPVRHAPTWPPGVSIVIPERDAPALLADALDSLHAALARVREPSQTIVVVNGAPLALYDALRARFPAVQWIHHAQPLGFSEAIAAGLRHARHAWTYLMNNDVTLAPDALAAVLDARAPDVFAIGSRIHQRSASGRQEETGFVDWHVTADGLHPFHAEPADDAVRPQLAASGGAALFRTAPLQRYVAAARVYAPFYYEDLEWGARAWQDGWRVLFCGASHVHHVHRATTARFYAPAELDAIVERNRRLFELRHDLGSDPATLMTRICALPYASQRALARPRVAAGVFAQRVRTHRAAPHGHARWGPLPPPRLALTGTAEAEVVNVPPVSYSYRLRRADPASQRPRVLVVTPFAVYPPRHGGGHRVAGLLARLRADYDVVLVSDEATLYDARSFTHFDGLYAVHLVQRRERNADAASPDLARRMRTHLHPALRGLVRSALWRYRPAIVQVEHAELADLVELRGDDERWVLALHDAYGLEDFADEPAAQRFASVTLPAYDAVTVCSDEDAALVRHRRVAVVPNGSSVPLDAYTPSAGTALLFAGPFRYGPNVTGIRAFLAQAFPGLRADVPDASVTILGGDEAARIVAGDPAFAQPGVRVLGHRDDVPALLAQSALTINPLEGIRGSPLKVVESLSAGRACVSTEQGARGFAHLGLGALIQARDVAGMRAPIARLLQDDAERHRIERPDAARLAPFQWSACARRQGTLYAQLLAS